MRVCMCEHFFRVCCMSHELLWMSCRTWQAICRQTWRLAVNKEHSLSQRYMPTLSIVHSPCLQLIGPSGYLYSGECLYTNIQWHEAELGAYSPLCTHLSEPAWEPFILWGNHTLQFNFPFIISVNSPYHTYCMKTLEVLTEKFTLIKQNNDKWSYSISSNLSCHQSISWVHWPIHWL